MPRTRVPTGNPPGPPPAALTREMLDDARDLLGRKQFLSRCVPALCGKYGIGRDVAYRLLDAARAEVIEDLRAQGQARDPLTAVVLFCQAVMADEAAPLGGRLGAAGLMVRILGLERYMARLDAQDAEDVLAGILARRLARLGGAVDPGAS